MAQEDAPELQVSADELGTAADEETRKGLGGTLSEEARFERELEIDAQQLEKDGGPLAKPFRAMHEAEQLGQEAQRGLEAELAREHAGDMSSSSEAAPKVDADGQPDTYAAQLESELEDHLCELRLEERRKAAEAEGAAAARPDGAPPAEAPPLDFDPAERT
mmetsp:Transcript_96343/g.167272  ORF Transcript_96343/g.167272 Transcript_96343/m.167272 type:complete len:162 (-) Transcript_96343:112-597(-)